MRMIEALFGWRKITAEGETAKRLTDFILQAGIPAELISEGGVTVVRVGRAAAKKIRAYLSENGLSADFGRLSGAPSLLLSLLHRPGIVAGLIAAVFLLIVARGRVWQVTVSGDGTLDEDEVRSIIEEAGLYPGVKVRDVSPNEVATKCLGREDLFSGVTVSLSGVVAEVTWIGREEGEPTRTDDAGEGVNLIAASDGVIVSVQPTAGTAVVSPGQTVHKGDLLISGVTRGGAVRAAGSVTAKVRAEFCATVKAVEPKRTVTERRPVSVSFKLFGKELFSFGEGGDSSTEREITLPGGVKFPFSFRVGYAHTVAEEMVERSEAEAARLAHRRLNWIIREALAEGELLKSEVSGGFADGGYIATAKTEYLINIAKPLAFSARTEYNK